MYGSETVILSVLVTNLKNRFFFKHPAAHVLDVSMRRCSCAPQSGSVCQGGNTGSKGRACVDDIWILYKHGNWLFVSEG